MKRKLILALFLVLSGLSVNDVIRAHGTLMPKDGLIQIVEVYDNSRSESRPPLALQARHGRIVRLGDDFPDWLRTALGWTQLDTERLRSGLIRRRDIEA